MSNLAPELVCLIIRNKYQKVNFLKCDVFSFGIAIFLALFGKYPYLKESINRIEDEIYKHLAFKNYSEFWK